MYRIRIWILSIIFLCILTVSEAAMVDLQFTAELSSSTAQTKLMPLRYYKDNSMQRIEQHLHLLNREIGERSVQRWESHAQTRDALQDIFQRIGLQTTLETYEYQGTTIANLSMPTLLWLKHSLMITKRSMEYYKYRLFPEIRSSEIRLTRLPQRSYSGPPSFQLTSAIFLVSILSIEPVSVPWLCKRLFFQLLGPCFYFINIFGIVFHASATHQQTAKMY